MGGIKYRAHSCPFKDPAMMLLHHFRVRIWLREIQFYAPLLIVALALFALLAR